MTQTIDNKKAVLNAYLETLKMVVKEKGAASLKAGILAVIHSMQKEIEQIDKDQIQIDEFENKMNAWREPHA